jgi:hypothetical protein
MKSADAVNRTDGSLDLDDPSPLLVPAPRIGLGQFIGQLATIGHYSFSRCGELLNVLASKDALARAFRAWAEGKIQGTADEVFEAAKAILEL